MLRQGLGDLLGNKTREGREKALREIERWRVAAEAITEAQNEAGIAIQLETELLTGPARAAAMLPSADYVSAVGLGEQACTKRAQVLSTAIEALDKEVKHRTKAASQAEDMLVSDQNRQILLLKQAGEANSTKLSAARSSHQSVIASVGHGLLAILASAVLGLCIYVCMGIVIGIADMIRGTETDCTILFCTLLCISTSLGITFAIWYVSSAIASNANASAAKMEAQEEHTKAVAAVNRTIRRDLPALAKTAADEKERLERAKTALSRLKALCDT